jgi:hypothetical protein
LMLLTAQPARAGPFDTAQDGLVEAFFRFF